MSDSEKTVIKTQKFDTKDWLGIKKKSELKDLCKEYAREFEIQKWTLDNIRHFLETYTHIYGGGFTQKHIATIVGLVTMIDQQLPNKIIEIINGQITAILNEFHLFSRGQNSALWLYEEEIGIYRENGEPIIRSTIAHRLRGEENYRSVIINEVVKGLKDLTYTDKEVGGKPNILVVRNGKVDLNDGSFINGFSHEDMQIVRIDVVYDPEADCPKIKIFLSEILENDDEIKAMFELIGYCLYKAWPYDIIVVFVGEGGNGKSVLLDVMKEFLGVDNITSMTMQTLAEEQFSVAELLGKFANLAGEIPSQPIRHTSQLKDLTGGNLIKGEKKYQAPFMFANFAKLIFSSNEPPPIWDDSTGMWRRMKTFAFPRYFDRADPNTIPRPTLVERLTTDEEMSGLLNEAIAGWFRLGKNGLLTGQKTPEETKVEYLRMSDPLHYLADFYFELDMKAPPTEKRALYELYTRWCGHEKKTSVADNTFHKNLRKWAGYISEKNPMVAGKRQGRTYYNIRVKTSALRREGVQIDDIVFIPDWYEGDRSTNGDQEQLNSKHDEQQIDTADTVVARTEERTIKQEQGIEDEPKPELRPKTKQDQSKKEGPLPGCVLALKELGATIFEQRFMLTMKQWNAFGSECERQGYIEKVSGTEFRLTGKGRLVLS